MDEVDVWKARITFGTKNMTLLWFSKDNTITNTEKFMYSDRNHTRSLCHYIRIEA